MPVHLATILAISSSVTRSRRSVLSLWRDEGAFHALRQRVMRTDFSWENSARRYGAVYEML